MPIQVLLCNSHLKSQGLESTWLFQIKAKTLTEQFGDIYTISSAIGSTTLKDDAPSLDRPIRKTRWWSHPEGMPHRKLVLQEWWQGCPHNGFIASFLELVHVEWEWIDGACLKAALPRLLQKHVNTLLETKSWGFKKYIGNHKTCDKIMEGSGINTTYVRSGEGGVEIVRSCEIGRSSFPASCHIAGLRKSLP